MKWLLCVGEQDLFSRQRVLSLLRATVSIALWAGLPEKGAQVICPESVVSKKWNPFSIETKKREAAHPICIPTSGAVNESFLLLYVTCSHAARLLSWETKATESNANSSSFTVWCWIYLFSLCFSLLDFSRWKILHYYQRKMIWGNGMTELTT